MNIHVDSLSTSRNNHDRLLLSSIVGISLYPNIGVRKVGVKNFTSEKGCKMKIHASSVNKPSGNAGMYVFMCDDYHLV